MKKRWLLILVGVLAFILVLGAGAAAGGAAAYYFLQAKPVQASYEIDFGGDQVVKEQGFLVALVEPDSPAEKAGIVRGDILTEVDGKALERPVDLFEKLKDHKSGDALKIALIHGDETHTVDVTLAERDGRAYLGVAPCACGFPEGGFGFRAFLLPLEGKAGALIKEVVSDSPADEAGLQKGDWITAVDGEELSPEADLAKLIQGHKPGDTVTLTVRPEGKEETKEVKVVLGENPETKGQAYLGVSYAPAPQHWEAEGDSDFFLPFPGFKEGETPNRPRFFHGMPFEQRLPELPEGVNQALIVGKVQVSSPAEKAGLKEGDLITGLDGDQLGEAETFVEAIKSHEPGDTISLTVYRSGEQEPLTVKITLGENPEKAGEAYLGVTVAGYVHMEKEGTPPDTFIRPFDFGSKDA